MTDGTKPRSLAMFADPDIVPVEAKPPARRPKGKGKLPRHKRGAMNRLERKYADHLDARKEAGEILEWIYEPFSLNLQDPSEAETDGDEATKKRQRARYTPDFLVQLADGSLEIHETKGFMTDASLVRTKWAATKFYMFTFRVVRWENKSWTFEEVAR